MVRTKSLQIALAALVLGAGALAAQSASATCYNTKHCSTSKPWGYIGDACGGHVSASGTGLAVNLNYGWPWNCLEAAGVKSNNQQIPNCYREDKTNDGVSVSQPYGCHEAVKVDIHGTYN